MKRKKMIIGATIVVVLALIYWLSSGGTSDSQSILVAAKKGDFKITVTTSGELEAKSSLKIYGPQGLQQVGIWRVNIEDIIPDGTLVDSGQYG